MNQVTLTVLGYQLPIEWIAAGAVVLALSLRGRVSGGGDVGPWARDVVVPLVMTALIVMGVWYLLTNGGTN